MVWVHITLFTKFLLLAFSKFHTGLLRIYQYGNLLEGTKFLFTIDSPIG